VPSGSSLSTASSASAFLAVAWLDPTGPAGPDDPYVDTAVAGITDHVPGSAFTGRILAVPNGYQHVAAIGHLMAGGQVGVLVRLGEGKCQGVVSESK
jgi:hypothetical protein